MDDLVSGICPETHALDALIEATLERNGRVNRQANSEAVLFPGKRHAPFPALVVQDAILEPVDKLVWMTILLQATDAGGSTLFPTYDDIRKTANIASKSTVARAISVLRVTRWLTLCTRQYESRGRFRGSVFALHDEPLPLADTLHLDSGYMQLLKDSQSNGHARVRVVASGVLDAIDEHIQTDLEVCTVEAPRVRQREVAETLPTHAPRRVFAFSTQVMAELRSQSPGKNGVSDPFQTSPPVDNRVRNLVHQKSNSGSCSSSNLKKTTTTQTTERKNFTRANGHRAPLIYPERLGENQRELADRYLATVSADLRQPILDELEGRFRSEKKGMPPLYDEMSFLFSLCKAMKNGEFKANLGIRVDEERRARQKAHRKRVQRSAPVPSVNARELCDRIAASEGPIAAMRKSLGVSHRHTRESDADESH